MNRNWISRLATSALALTMGSGMLFMSGCNDCDSCSEKVETTSSSCCEEVPVETSYDQRVQREQPTTYESESARRDFDQGTNVSAPSAPAAPDVNVNLQQPAAPAPDVNVNVQQPAAPAPNVNVQQPAAPAPKVNVEQPAAPAVKGPDVNIAPAPQPAPAAPSAPAAPAAPESNAAPAADHNAPAAESRAETSTKANLASDMDKLSFFLGNWNVEEHMVKDQGWGTDFTGTANFKSSADGHALTGDLSLKGDKGNYDAHVVIAANRDTAMKVSKDLGFGKDSDFASEKSDEKAMPTSADKDADMKATDVSNQNQFYVFFSDSKGHSGMSKHAWLDGDKFNEVFEFTKDGKTMTKHKVCTKESNDKISTITDMDDGSGMARFSAGTLTRAK